MEELLYSALAFMSSSPREGYYFTYTVDVLPERVKFSILAFDECGRILGGYSRYIEVSSWYYKRCGASRQEKYRIGAIRHFFRKLGHPLDMNKSFSEVAPNVYKAIPDRHVVALMQHFA